MSDAGAVSFPSLLYVVAAPLGDDLGDDQPAFIVDELPLGTFDERLTPALIGVWYAMHLPKNRFEMLDLRLGGIQATANGFPRPHHILLIPRGFLLQPDLMRALVGPFEPVLLIVPAEDEAVAASVSAQVGFTLPPARLDDLNQLTLESHWQALTASWAKEWPTPVTVDPAVPRWSWPIPPDGSLLSLVRLSRLMGQPIDPLPEHKDPFGSAIELRRARLYLDALVQLENEGVASSGVERALPGAMRAAAVTQRPRLALSLSGTAPRYVKLSADELGVGTSTFNDSYPDVRTILVTHAATGNDSLGIVLEDVLSPKAFHVLSDLERHWAERARPAAVRKLLARLNAETTNLWSDELVLAIKSSSMIDAFTNFPIGLLTLPGDTAPLSSRLPVSYRSVNPLTRALQFELNPRQPQVFGPGVGVLVAECIPSSDPVGHLSRRGWEAVAQEMKSSGEKVKVTLAETFSKDALRAAVQEYRPDILVLSAHGFSAPESNVAGVTIGTEPSLGDDLGEMPPLVILSACHTSPRGAGVVNVGDLLVRAGARAVLSTLVPVDVTHNAQTMSRFFRYLSKAIAENTGSEPTSLLEVWHETQLLNVVIDLTYGHTNLQQWAFERVGGPSPIERFMSSDHGVPLRGPHIYEDAEQRLLKVAARTGDAERVQSWLRSPGYLPESLMYTLIGDPQQLSV